MVESLLRVRDAARILTCSERSVWRLLGRGALSSIRVGSCVRIDASELQQFIARGGTHDAR
jgi:excisionase family DNA binding protein